MTVDFPNRIIDVPQSDLTFVGGTLYRYPTNTKFRVDLMAIMDNEEGIVFPQSYQHTAGKVIAGVTYAPFIEIINSYQVRFEDGLYTVLLEESNNDIWDVGGGILFQNQVQVIPQNSAGLIQVSSGSGLSTDQDNKLTAIHSKLPSDGDEIAGENDTGGGGGSSPWTTQEKDDLITNMETTKRQATKAANNTIKE